MQKVTIGVPFFNAENYLDRCIQSILSQTFKDWELILVDDGSTDNSLDICKKYSHSDNRIKILSGQHKGVGAARNLVIENAIGEFLCFIDADDCYEADYLESLLNRNNFDLVVCGYIVDNYSNKHVFLNSKKYIQPELELTSESERLLLKEAFASGIMCFVWNKLFKIEIIRQNNIFFRNFPVNEDFIFVLDYILCTQSIAILNKALYHWVRIEGNISAVESIPENILQIYEQSHSLLAQFLKSDMESDKIFYYTYELIIYKYLRLYRNGFISSSVCYNSLAKLHNSRLVKRSFISYKPSTKLEIILYFFNRYGLFRITNILQKLIYIWK